jgi:trimethylamine--corrinoid protein Co-methyltransferase
MIQTPATLLSSEQVHRIHEASLEILKEIGLLVRSEHARKIYAKHGCTVDPDTKLVKFPNRLVEEHRSAIPPSFTFYGADPQYDRSAPEDRPVIITGSSAPNLIDPVSGVERPARSEDIARIAHLVNTLSGYDIFSISTLAEDAPADKLTLWRLYPALKNCRKPIRASGPREEAEAILQLAIQVAGSEAAYRARPFITHHYCPVVSPLTMDIDSTANLIFFTEEGLPCYPSVVPNAGLTSPLTLTGTLAQGNAEFLAAAVLEQMISPGKATLYSVLATVADMRTGAYTPGAIETGMLQMGFSQIARYYNIPSGGYIGLSNAKIPDAQSGYETGMSTVAALLGGADVFNMAGLLDSLMTFDFAKAVIDDEIAQMLKRLQQGFDFCEENLALDVIKEAEPGGTFIDHEHTLSHMRTTGLFPPLADRKDRQMWESLGSLDTQQRAQERVRQILSSGPAATFSPEADARIRAHFKELPAGKHTPPEPWRDAAKG